MNISAKKLIERMLEFGEAGYIIYVCCLCHVHVRVDISRASLRHWLVHTTVLYYMGKVHSSRPGDDSRVQRILAAEKLAEFGTFSG